MVFGIKKHACPKKFEGFAINNLNIVLFTSNGQIAKHDWHFLCPAGCQSFQWACQPHARKTAGVQTVYVNAMLGRPDPVGDRLQYLSTCVSSVFSI